MKSYYKIPVAIYEEKYCLQPLTTLYMSFLWRKYDFYLLEKCLWWTDFNEYNILVSSGLSINQTYRMDMFLVEKMWVALSQNAVFPFDLTHKLLHLSTAKEKR